MRRGSKKSRSRSKHLRSDDVENNALHVKTDVKSFEQLMLNINFAVLYIVELTI
jgi:hypothetical protein